MADVLYLKDGTSKVVIGNEADVLRNLIETRLGRDCAHLFDRIRDPDIDPVDGYCTEGDNYEDDCEALHGLCVETLEALDIAIKLLEQPRLDKSILAQTLKNARSHLYCNM